MDCLQAQSTDKHTCINKTPHTCKRWHEHTHTHTYWAHLFESHQQHYHRMLNTLSYEMNAHRQIHALRSTLANKQNVNSTQTLSTLPMQKSLYCDEILYIRYKASTKTVRNEMISSVEKYENDSKSK